MIRVPDRLAETNSHEHHAAVFEDESAAPKAPWSASWVAGKHRARAQTYSPEREKGAQAAASGSPGDSRFHRSRTSMRISEYESKFADSEVAPAWLLAAQAEYPHLTALELRTVRDMFELHAVSIPAPDAPSGSTLVVTRAALGDILEESLKSFFNEIDEDSSGSLERPEVAKLVGKLGKTLSNDEIDTLMADLDRNGDGGVEFAEFKVWYQSEPDTERELDDMFQQVDEDYSGNIEWGEFVQMIGRNLDHTTNIQRMESGESLTGPPASPSKQAGKDKQGKDGKGARLRSVSFKDRDPATLVRHALESVRSDIRAIYGMSAHNRPALQLATDEEREAANRICFFRPDGDGWSVKFKKTWDIVQVVILVYVAAMVPFRIGFRQELSPDDPLFWVDVGVDAYFWYARSDKPILQDWLGVGRPCVCLPAFDTRVCYS